MSLRGPSGIAHRFQWLFRSEGYVGYVLLTLSPLYSSEDFRARLACLIHAASVRSEPGSNPSVEVFDSYRSREFDGPLSRLVAPARLSRVTLVFKERAEGRACPRGALSTPLACGRRAREEGMIGIRRPRSTAWRRKRGRRRHAAVTPVSTGVCRRPGELGAPRSRSPGPRPGLA